MANDDILVAYHPGGILWQYSADGTSVIPLWANQYFAIPISVAVAPSGDVYVAERGVNEVPMQVSRWSSSQLAVIGIRREIFPPLDNAARCRYIAQIFG